MRSVIESLLLVAGVTVFARLLDGHVSIANLALFYLLPVMVQSGRRGLAAGLLTSLLAALVFNFFLVPPRHTLHIADSDNFVTLLVLFAVALAVSELSSRLRTQAARAERLQGDRQREQLRETLLSSISHDLRTPLTVIRAGLESLSNAEPENRAAALATVKAETTRLERMVSNLLELNRLEVGAARAEDEVIDLTDTIAAVIDSLTAAYDVPIRVAVAHDLPLVRADTHMLHHMLINLTENAILHGGGEDVEISAVRDGDALVLAVSDRGAGITAGEEEAIFKRFNRLERNDRAGKGSGLGLAIVRGFGDALQVETRAAHRPDGSGAVFSIRFPHARLVTPAQAA